MYVGVMGYQGAGHLHIATLKTLGLKCCYVRSKDDFRQDLDALIMPGGESSAQYKYCIEHDIFNEIKNFAKAGKIIFGTCAGLILLSSYKSQLVNGIGLLDLEVERNCYGRQNASGVMLSDSGQRVSFIRAPGITSLGKKVRVIDTYNGSPIFVSQAIPGSEKHTIYGATFHPEIPIDSKISNYYTELFCTN